MKKLLLFLTLAILFIPIDLDAQYRRKSKKDKKPLFAAGATVGLNIGQIDGDKTNGYNKSGVSGGLIGIINFTNNFNLSLGFTFDQRGAKTQQVAESRGSIPTQRRDMDIRLNYASVPLLLNFHFKEGQRVKHVYGLHIGMAYSRLVGTELTQLPAFRTRSENIRFNEFQDDYNNNDFSFIIGFGIHVTNQFELRFSHVASVSPLYEGQYDPNDSETQIKLAPYHISLGVFYTLN